MKIEIEMYFEKPNDISKKVSEIKQMVYMGKMEHTGRKYRYRVLFGKEPKYRYDEIDGVKYVVYESKMNEKK
tara:strand:+ start:677 stop:892 length:216 start_codon:yes stop_codon:yes gene_type:complete